jgi:Na+-translocating ferredoxin:NAD+ oxidoreductase subunit C
VSHSGITFKRGGVHPAEEKQLTDPAQYAVMPMPEQLTIAMAQHLGAPAKAVVAARDSVAAGQKLGEAQGFVSVDIHSPVAGTVKSLEMVHIGAVNSPAVVVKPAEGAEVTPYERDAKPLDLDAFDAKQIIERIKDAGLVGMGGAAFPTHVKLSPPPGVKIDTVVINGAECEPYLTADDCLMRNHPVQIIEGTRAFMKATGVTQAYIGIENNKPEAYKSLKEAAAGVPGIKVMQLRTRYPQGAEKQLIEALVGRRVPPGKLPFSVGVVVQNVATAAATYEALAFERPLYRRLLTVSGRAVAKPQNVLVPQGVSVSEILAFCGGLKEDCAEIVMGGPMMGRATSDLSEPTVKSSSGILFLAPGEIQVVDELPCLRCGECVRACPMGLVPTELMSYIRCERFEEAQGCLDCIECGSCAYICPSYRRLVHWFRLGKWEINRLRKREQLKAKEAEAKAAASK